MYIKFTKNWVSKSVKSVHTNLFAKNGKLHKFQLTIAMFLKNNYFRHTSSDNVHMYFKFHPNRVGISVKTVHTNLFAKKYKLHKFATTNSNLKQ